MPAAPWVTAGVFFAALAPHVWWLVANNFPPITWVTTRRLAASFGDTLGSMAEYLGGTAAYGGIAIALVLVFVRPGRTALVNGFVPRDERRMAAILFWTPLLLPLLAALITGTSLLSLWSTPALNLLPVMLLGSPLLIVPRVAVLRLASQGIAVTPGSPFAVEGRTGPGGHVRVTTGLVRDGHAVLAERIADAARTGSWTAQQR